MLKKIILIGLPMTLILSGVYYQLGGFNEVEVQLINTNNYVIAGREYQGLFNEDSLSNYFIQIKEYADDGQSEGVVGVVTYGLDSVPRDSIHQFFGIMIGASPYKIPEDFEVDTLYAQKAVRAIVCAHPMVMPHPDQVITKIRAYAQKVGLSIKDYSIEQYTEENEIWVDIPLSNNAL